MIDIDLTKDLTKGSKRTVLDKTQKSKYIFRGQ